MTGLVVYLTGQQWLCMLGCHAGVRDDKETFLKYILELKK